MVKINQLYRIEAYIMKKTIILMGLITILLNFSICSANITREEHDDFIFYYFQTTRKYSTLYIAFVYDERGYPGQLENAQFFGHVWLNNHSLMSKNRDIELHIGNISYDLRNRRYSKPNKNSANYKSCSIPLAAMNKINESEPSQMIYFAIPLEDGTYYKYFIFNDELNEFKETYLEFGKETGLLSNESNE
jgi:hypothetical protein